MRNYDPFKAPTHFKLVGPAEEVRQDVRRDRQELRQGRRRPHDGRHREAPRAIAGTSCSSPACGSRICSTTTSAAPRCASSRTRTQEGEISFCAYNTGIGWRNIIEKMHMTATLTKWYEEHGRHEIFAGGKNVPLAIDRALAGAERRSGRAPARRPTSTSWASPRTRAKRSCAPRAEAKKKRDRERADGRALSPARAQGAAAGAGHPDPGARRAEEAVSDVRSRKSCTSRCSSAQQSQSPRHGRAASGRAAVRFSPRSRPSCTSPARLPRAVLWDMDGTLADSGEQHWHAWRDAMAAAGRTLTRDSSPRPSGSATNASCAAGWATISPRRSWRGSATTKEAVYRRRIEADGLCAAAGRGRRGRRRLRRRRLASGRRLVRPAGQRRGHASGDRPRRSARRDRRRRGRRTASPPRMSSSPPRPGSTSRHRRCIVVEDAAVGVEAARRAGMRSIGVSPASRGSPRTWRSRSLDDLAPGRLRSSLSAAPAGCSRCRRDRQPEFDHSKQDCAAMQCVSATRSACGVSRGGSRCRLAAAPSRVRAGCRVTGVRQAPRQRRRRWPRRAERSLALARAARRAGQPERRADLRHRLRAARTKRIRRRPASRRSSAAAAPA